MKEETWFTQPEPIIGKEGLNYLSFYMYDVESYCLVRIRMQLGRSPTTDDDGYPPIISCVHRVVGTSPQRLREGRWEVKSGSKYLQLAYDTLLCTREPGNWVKSLAVLTPYCSNWVACRRPMPQTSLISVSCRVRIRFASLSIIYTRLYAGYSFANLLAILASVLVGAMSKLTGMSVTRAIRLAIWLAIIDRFLILDKFTNASLIEYTSISGTCSVRIAITRPGISPYNVQFDENTAILFF